MIEVGTAVTIAGVVILSLTSIGGWIYTLRKNGRAEGRMQQQVTALIQAVGNLPCQVDSDYLQNMGALTQAVKNLEGGQSRVEDEQGAIHKRMDNLVDSGGPRRKGT